MCCPLDPEVWVQACKLSYTLQYGKNNKTKKTNIKHSVTGCDRITELKVNITCIYQFPLLKTKRSIVAIDID